MGIKTWIWHTKREKKKERESLIKNQLKIEIFLK